MVGLTTGHYWLGTGNNGDTPWTPDPNGKPASDCAGFAICYAWMLTRHRPGFNRGWWATVEDDINCNSAIEDGQHTKELFDTLNLKGTGPLTAWQWAMPQPGDLLTYPTIYIVDQTGKTLTFVGHVCIIESVPADFKQGDRWSRLTVIQCHGPNGFTPGVVRTDGAIWDHHDAMWPKPKHRSVIVRPHARTA